MKRLLLYLIPICFCTQMVFAANSNISKIKLTETANPNWDVKIYPNPNNGIFSLMINGSSASLHVMVFNVIGEKVFELDILGDHGAKIDLSGLDKGLYIVQIIEPKKSKMLTRRMHIE